MPLMPMPPIPTKCTRWILANIKSKFLAADCADLRGLKPKSANRNSNGKIRVNWWAAPRSSPALPRVRQYLSPRLDATLCGLHHSFERGALGHPVAHKLYLLARRRRAWSLLGPRLPLPALT